MAGECILVEKSEGVAILTMNRPEQLNAMSYQLSSELHDAVTRMGADDEVGCLVITGAGNRAFSAAGDIHEQREDDRLRGARGGDSLPEDVEVVHVARGSSWGSYACSLRHHPQPSASSGLAPSARTADRMIPPTERLVIPHCVPTPRGRNIKPVLGLGGPGCPCHRSRALPPPLQRAESILPEHP
jgi:hypothetical protein